MLADSAGSSSNSSCTTVSVTPSQDVRRIDLTVAGVLVCFAFLFYVDVFVVIVPWLSYSVPGVTNLGVLVISTSLALYTYSFCIFVEPGRVPDGWQPDTEAVSVQEVKKKSGTPRFCQKCQRWKPPRSHHCRICRRCVLRMDHHCPWTNNCIGHANHRAFLHFLVYVNAALVHTLGLIAAHAVHTLQTSQEHRVLRTGPQSEPVQLQGAGGLRSIWLWAALQTMAFALALPLTIALLMLLGWHVHLVLRNKTTIEYQEGVNASIQAAAGGPTYEHPYDLGPCNNLHEILGDSALGWVLPPCAATEGGTRYPTIWDERALGFMHG